MPQTDLTTEEKSSIFGLSVGVDTDLQILLNNFKDAGSVRYEEFSRIWRDLKMTFIFAGRSDIREQREFTEDAILSALTILCSTDVRFETKIGSFYFIYAVYMKQPLDPKVKIRLTMNQWQQLLGLMQEAQEGQHLDAVFIFWTLRYHMAFQYTAHPHTMYPKSKYEQSKEITKFLQLQESGSHVTVNDVVNSDVINQISAIHEQYHQMKCSLAGPSATKPDPAFNVLRDDLVQDITKSLTAHEEWKKAKDSGKSRRGRRESGATTSGSEVDSDYEPRSKQGKKSRGERRAEIRERAFAAKASPTRSRRRKKARESQKAKNKKKAKSGSDVPSSQEDDI